MIVHDKIKFALMILIFLTAFNAAYSQQKSPWRVLAEQMWNCIPDTMGVFIVDYPIIYDTLIKIQQETGTHSGIKTIFRHETIESALPRLKGKVPIYMFGICHIEPYITVDSIDHYGLIEIYNPFGYDYTDSSYKMLMRADLSFFNDPLYWSDTLKCQTTYSYTLEIGLAYTNIFLHLEKDSPEKACSLVYRMRPYLVNNPMFVEILIHKALENDSTSIYGMSVDSLLSILEDWCERNPNTFGSEALQKDVQYFRERYMKLKLKNEPNP